MVCVVVGGQFGDEGKGKILSYLCKKDDFDIVARGGVGPNAGHTVIADGKKYGIRQVPSGFPNRRSRLLIGAGVLVNPVVLLYEAEKLKKFGVRQRLGVDYRCIVIEEQHKERDTKSKHLKEKVGTTGTGCGPANEDRVKRLGKRFEDVFKDEYDLSNLDFSPPNPNDPGDIKIYEDNFKNPDEGKLKEELKGYCTDVSKEVNRAIDEGKDVLLEGTQGFNLSVYYGTYPFVTSKDVSASSMAADVGIGPTKVKDVIVVFKSYVSRVGGGELEGELSREEIEVSGIWKKISGVEVGTVTGRPRRIAEFNFERAKKAIEINGATQIALTCIDMLYPECYGKTGYDELSDDAKKYISRIENELGVPITLVSTGPELESTIDLR